MFSSLLGSISCSVDMDSNLDHLHHALDTGVFPVPAHFFLRVSDLQVTAYRPNVWQKAGEELLEGAQTSRASSTTR